MRSVAHDICINIHHHHNTGFLVGLLAVISILFALFVYIKYHPKCNEGKRNLLDSFIICKYISLNNLPDTSNICRTVCFIHNCVVNCDIRCTYFSVFVCVLYDYQNRLESNLQRSRQMVVKVVKGSICLSVC